MDKVYMSAPLPFMGQKRRFIGEFKKILNRYPADITVVDLFGGSGLLSHTAKRIKPKARVIYNDYDGYSERLAHIEETNATLSIIREIAAVVPRHKALPENIKASILQVILEAERNTGYVDYVTLSSSLLFSSQYAKNYEELAKEKFYSKARRNDYMADGYLDGLEITHEDYKTVFEQYKDEPRALFLVDPPYLSTEVSPYRMSWRLSDYLDVLSVLEGHSYVYFTSNKSGIIELCEWLGRHPYIGNPFANSKRLDIGTSINYNSSYTDTMLYKTSA